MLVLLNKIGLYLLLFLLIVIPFHFKSGDFGIAYYYREITSICFVILLFVNLLNEKPFPLIIRKEIFYLILFPFLLCLSAFYDPMIILYKNGASLEDITSQIIHIDPRIYILRNALLYLPMILYFSTRGITEEELNKIAIVSLVIAPLSIIFYLLTLLEESTFSVFILGEINKNPGIAIAYNSYVPYLNFPIISGFYLYSKNYNRVLKIMTLFMILFIFIFVFLSTSRQTLILIFISGFLFFIFNYSKNNFKKYIIFFFVMIISFNTYSFIVSETNLNENLYKKYTENILQTNNRIGAVTEGLQILKPYQYITGAGLSSVIVSGPHNDYVRWIQRVGFIFMIISFFPYFLITFKCFHRLRRYNHDLIFLYIGVANLFIIYHSFFGYPREDAYQAVWSFLGMTLWLGYTKHMYISLKNTETSVFN